MKPNERLRAEREALGFSQKAFAELVGASKSTQIRWESGETTPGVDALLKWAEFGLDLSYVLTGVRSIKVAVADPEEQQRATELVDSFLQLPEADQQAVQTHANALLRAAIATGKARSVRRRVPADEQEPSTGERAPTITKVTARGKGNIAIGSIHGGTQTIKPSKA